MINVLKATTSKLVIVNLEQITGAGVVGARS
jgi:hypothetical protein